MDLRRLKLATFANTSLALLQQAVNDVTAGKAVLAADSGTVTYAAGWVGSKHLIDQRFAFDGTTYTCALFYAE